MNSPLPHATPSPERFADCMGDLGISRAHRIVVYEGCAGYESAPGAWFLFHLFGHADVKVLEGGLVAWADQGGPLEAPPPRGPSPSPADKTTYSGASVKPGLLINVSLLVDNLSMQRVQLVDCRSPSLYHGEAKDLLFNVANHGHVQFYDHRPGHVPGAKNVPFEGLVQQARRVSTKPLPLARSSSLPGVLMTKSHSSGDLTLGLKMVLPADQLVTVFERAQVDLRQPVALICATGIITCTITWSFHVLSYVLAQVLISTVIAATVISACALLRHRPHLLRTSARAAQHRCRCDARPGRNGRVVLRARKVAADDVSAVTRQPLRRRREERGRPADRLS